jgi:hypothetical protein
MKLEFSRHVFEKNQIQNFITIHPLGVELFHAGGRTDGQTDRKTDERPGEHNEAHSHFSQFLRQRLKGHSAPLVIL